MTAKKTALKARLARLEAEYNRCLLEIASLPNGNGYATQKEMRTTVGQIYGSTIAGLKRDLAKMR